MRRVHSANLHQQTQLVSVVPTLYDLSINHALN